MNVSKDIERLINEIIPPDDYQHRNGFSNTHIIDKLNNQERNLVEDVLIGMLSDKTDILIVETLAYLQSIKSLPILYTLFDKKIEESAKIIIAASIFQINKDNQMLEIAINAFKDLEKLKDAYYVYRLLPMFYYLREFKNETTDAIIKEYVNHSEYLLSSNAKQVLGYI